MAGTSLLALLDDIASVLDDIAVLTKVATKKTAGVLGDDLALNAQQVAGVRAERELPVIWAVAKGSAVNKAILVPAALAISQFIPWAVVPLLMFGGAFLCFEGFEKIAHKYLPHGDDDHAEHVAAVADPSVDLVALEKDKIKGAIRTDFVLSAEIVAISLGTVAEAPFVTRLLVLTGISIIMTVGVYGFVAGIVKLDDLGLYLTRRGELAGAQRGQLQRAIGGLLLRSAPYLMKTLSVAGMIAVFLVGGGILTHGIPALHHGIEGLAAHAQRVPAIGGLLAMLVPSLLDGLAGLIAGALAVALVMLVRSWFARGRARRSAKS